jgi:hypothetical protein
MCIHIKRVMILAEDGAEQGIALRSDAATASQRTGFAAAVQPLLPRDFHRSLYKGPAAARRKQPHTVRTAHFGLLFSE